MSHEIERLLEVIRPRPPRMVWDPPEVPKRDELAEQRVQHVVERAKRNLQERRQPPNRTREAS